MAYPTVGPVGRSGLRSHAPIYTYPERLVLSVMGHILSEPVTEIDTELHRSELFTVASASCQGWRTTMEDTHTVMLPMPSYPDVSYLAVFDGHGGVKTADACSKLLHKYIFERDEFAEGNVAKAIEQGFIELDDKMRSMPWDESGSTAIIVIIKDDFVYCGNAGDSRCVAMIGGDVVELSVDHKPGSPSERERIYRAGGWVEGGRVNGILSLSRALGDFSLKNPPGLQPYDYIVSAVPEVRVLQLSPDWDFLILACDGIWDVMTSREVVEEVRRLLDMGLDAEEICRRVITQCRSPSCGPRSLGCDNMTMLLVIHHPPSFYPSSSTSSMASYVQEENWNY